MVDGFCKLLISYLISLEHPVVVDHEIVPEYRGEQGLKGDCYKTTIANIIWLSRTFGEKKNNVFHLKAHQANNKYSFAVRLQKPVGSGGRLRYELVWYHLVCCESQQTNNL